MATKRVNYTEEDFLTAYKAVSMGVSLRKASALSNVPRSTLKDRINRNHLERRRQGPATLLTDDEEVQLAQWIISCWRAGFSCCSRIMIRNAARTLLKKSQRNVRYTEFGKRWFSGFTKRHRRVLEAMNTKYVPQQASWKFGTEQLQLWFERIGAHISELGLDYVMQQPQRIFHCMEGKFKELSILCAYSASCKSTPPVVSLPQSNEPLTLPKGWGLYYTKNSATTSTVCHENAPLLEYYLQNVFYPYLVNIQVEFPIVVFLDYQKHPPTFKILEICQQLNIVLINLYSMAFHKLRYALKNNIQTWFDNTSQNLQTRSGLIDAIKDALVSQVTKSKMKHAFYTSGIYPFKIENVDTAHFMQTNAAPPNDFDDSKSTVNKEMANTSKDSFNLNFNNFKNLIGLQLLDQLEQHETQAEINDSTPEFLALHKIYMQFIDAEKKSSDANVPSD